VPTTENKVLRERIRATLVHRAGSGTDANAVAEAALGTWHDMANRLSPVIGKGGVEALFRRSLHITSATFPWLSIAAEVENGAALLVDLKVRLSGREAAVAAEAGHVLLATFAELLATLIGNSLTEHLLDPIWEATSAATDKEISS
jgi:hypothetical protein